MLGRFSRVWLFVTLWTVARQAPLSLDFSRQEYWHRLLFPSLGDLPDPGIKLSSPSIAGKIITIWATRGAVCRQEAVSKYKSPLHFSKGSCPGAYLQEWPHFYLKSIYQQPSLLPGLYFCVRDSPVQQSFWALPITPTSVSINSFLLSSNKLGKYCQEGNYEDHN